VAPSSTLADGYPPNADRYAGSTPLFAGRAVQAPAEARAKPAVLVPAQAADCSFFVHMAALDPPTIQVGGAPVELRRVPTTTQIERTFAILAAVEGDLEKRGPEPSAERLLDLACLTALYDDAATDLALASDVELSRLSAEKRRRYAGEGAKLLAGIDWDSPAGNAVLAGLAGPGRGAERSWIVLVLRGGEAPLLRLATTAGKYDWGRLTTLAALVAAPATRARALALMGALPKNAQIDAMHEIFRTHDHLRPWASNYVLDDAGDGEVARAYRVFRALAWGLWEGARPQDEVLASLLRDTAAAHLDRAWVVGLLEYYGRNMLALHYSRDDAQVMAAGFARWLGAHGYTDTEVYEPALEAARGPD
jgi:hypothetical protein